MQLSRREKLQEFIAKRQILEEEKRKKSKPIFRAGGVVNHPYSAFGNSLCSQCKYDKLSFRSSRNSNPDGGKILHVIEEDTKDLKLTKEESSKQMPSFAP